MTKVHYIKCDRCNTTVSQYVTAGIGIEPCKCMYSYYEAGPIRECAPDIAEREKKDMCGLCLEVYQKLMVKFWKGDEI